MKSKILLLTLLFAFAVSGPAQEKGKVGLLFKTGALNSVGVSYKLSGTMTLRASFGFDTYDSKTEYQYQILEEVSHDRDEYNASLGLFFDLVKKKDLTLYSGIEAGISYYTTESILSEHYAAGGITLFPAYEEKSETNGYNGNIILGIQHKIGKRFAIFGEIGFGFNKDHRDDRALADGKLICDKTTQWNLSRSGIGVVFYL